MCAHYDDASDCYLLDFQQNRSRSKDKNEVPVKLHLALSISIARFRQSSIVRSQIILEDKQRETFALSAVRSHVNCTRAARQIEDYRCFFFFFRTSYSKFNDRSSKITCSLSRSLSIVINTDHVIINVIIVALKRHVEYTVSNDRAENLLARPSRVCSRYERLSSW